MIRRRSPRIYEWFFLRVLPRLDPESKHAELAHTIALSALRAYGKIPRALKLTDRLLRPPRSLRVEAMGLTFRSPLGVAAGVDKNSTAFDGLAALGFGAVEVGTATNIPQEGNAGRRVWRLPVDRAILNAMGFPNEGAAVQGRRLARRRTEDAVIGANIGKSMAIEIASGDVVGDYREATRQLGPHADYIAINVSSPNTPGLRDMQTIDYLQSLVAGVRAELDDLARAIPVLIKLGPDLTDSQIAEIAAVANSRIKVDGIIAVNTTTDYESSSTCRAAIKRYGDKGGVSGRPLKSRALEVLQILHLHAGDTPLISVGGIEDADDVWSRILAGATLVQVHTGFVYGGPLWPHRLSRDLARLLADSPYATIAEAIGAAHRSASGAGADDGAGNSDRLGSRATAAA
jgi:dihydroorotate dehydrogenase